MSGVTPEMIEAGVNQWLHEQGISGVYTAMKALDPEVERLREMRAAVAALRDSNRQAAKGLRPLAISGGFLGDFADSLDLILSPNTSQGTPNEE